MATFTQGQIDDLFHAVDWSPSDHPAAPTAVTAGKQPDVMACGYCHLMNGAGRPENAALAGVPADYIIRQVTEPDPAVAPAPRRTGRQAALRCASRPRTGSATPTWPPPPAISCQLVLHRPRRRSSRPRERPRLSPRTSSIGFDFDLHKPSRLSRSALDRGRPAQLGPVQTARPSTAYTAFVPPACGSLGARPGAGQARRQPGPALRQLPWPRPDRDGGGAAHRRPLAHLPVPPALRLQGRRADRNPGRADEIGGGTVVDGGRGVALALSYVGSQPAR